MLEIKNKEIKHAFSRLISRLDTVKGRIVNFKIGQTEKKKRTEYRRTMGMKFMHNCNTRKRKENGVEGEIFEVAIAEMLPKFLTETKPQVSEAQRTPSKINTKQTNK